METVDGGQQQVDHVFHVFSPRRLCWNVVRISTETPFLQNTNDKEGNDSGWVKESCFLRRHVTLPTFSAYGSHHMNHLWTALFLLLPWHCRCRCRRGCGRWKDTEFEEATVGPTAGVSRFLVGRNPSQEASKNDPKSDSFRCSGKVKILVVMLTGGSIPKSNDSKWRVTWIFFGKSLSES